MTYIVQQIGPSGKIVQLWKEALELVWLFLWDHYLKKHVSHLKIQYGGHFQDGRRFRYAIKSPRLLSYRSDLDLELYILTNQKLALDFK